MTKQKSIGIGIAIILLISIANTVHAVTEENCINSIKEAERQIKEGYDYAQAGSNYYSAYKCYEKLGMNGSKYYALAIESCSKAYNLTEQYYGALCLGDIYKEMGDIDIAIDWYLKSCTSRREERKDDCSLEYARITRCYASLRDKDKTCEWCEKTNAEASGFLKCGTEFKGLGIVCGSVALSSNQENTDNSPNKLANRENKDSSSFLIIAIIGVVLLALIAVILSKKKK